MGYKDVMKDIFSEKYDKSSSDDDEILIYYKKFQE